MASPNNTDTNGQNGVLYPDELDRVMKFVGPIQLPWYVYYATVFKLADPSRPLVACTSAFGTITNVINMVIFHRQGYLKDSYSISLMFLAFADFISNFFEFTSGFIRLILVTLDRKNPDAVMNMYLNQPVSAFTLSLNKVVVIVFGCINIILMELSGWVTAYMSVERMVSVMFPFKVRRIFTSKLAFIFLGVILTVNLLLQTPRFYGSKFIWREMVGSNGTLRLDFVDNRLIPRKVINTLTLINKSILRLVYIPIIVICNVILAIKVNTSQKFRKSISSTPKSQTKSQTKSTVQTDTDKTSADVTTQNSSTDNSKTNKEKTPNNDNSKAKKELRLIRTMYLLSFTFLISRIPESLIMIILEIQESISKYWFWHGYDYTRFFYVALQDLGRYMVNLNGGTNIFIYLLVNRKYRQMFVDMFFCCKRKITS